MIKFDVKGKRLLIQEPPKELVSKGGIILVDGSRDIANVMEWSVEIIGVGDEVENIQVGDFAIIDPTVELPMFNHPETGKKCMFINSGQILAILKNIK